MYYEPHILQVWQDEQTEHDEFGRIVKLSDGGWVDVCGCRCDDNHSKLLKTETGEIYRSSYRIACDKTDGITMGDKVRCLNRDDLSERGSGIVGDLVRTNYLGYMQIWL
ncbi:MAG: hypothetical protein IJ640_09105 [Prevotella sp.]|nr:hypothetical protein [Prevotella sp.]